MTRQLPLVRPVHFSATVIAILLLALPTLAQQDQTPAQQSEPSSQRQSEQRKAGQDDENKQQAQQSGTSNDRLFFTLPNFLTVENAGQVPPLTTGQKFKTVTRAAFDYVEFPWYGALAGISQAENSEAGYGQGASGYAKRYGAAFADGTIENFWVNAILPSTLHQDPRYFQMSKGSVWHRTTYAISRIFITRSDSGHSQFNYSEIFGSAIAAGISTYTYHPQNERTVSNTASVWGTEMGYDALTFVIKEFWPDLRRKLTHKTNPQ